MGENGWSGELDLRYERRGLRTVLAARRHRGPLLVQKALYPESPAVCHGIVLHPPAGIVGGDTLSLQARVCPAAHALLTTPGAGKWYRSDGRIARQQITLGVDAGGVLEWLPQPAIAFDEANGRMRTDIDVAVDATFLGWDMLCLGRTASGERFRAGLLLTRLHVAIGGSTAWLERGRIEGGSRLLSSPVGLGGEPVTGTFLAVSPRVDAALAGACREVAATAGQVGVTRLPGLLVARYLGPSTEAGHDYFARLWAVLRPALTGLAAQPPRIWRT